VALAKDRKPVTEWRQIWPIGANRGPVPSEVPGPIAQDYIEACNVLPISAKASAALSRRCLQNMLHAADYRDRDLSREVDLLLNEPDPRKGPTAPTARDRGCDPQLRQFLGAPDQ
jgi:hypothetical protein